MYVGACFDQTARPAATAMIVIALRSGWSSLQAGGDGSSVAVLDEPSLTAAPTCEVDLVAVDHEIQKD
jgi:hypothetical protein